MLTRLRPPVPIRPLLVAAVGVAVLLSSTMLAAAETPEQLREKRKQVQADEAALAADIDLVASDATDVQDALDAIQGAVDSQIAAVESARRGVDQAEAASLAARDRITELEQRQQAALNRLQAQAIEAYVSFQAPAGDVSFLGDDPWKQARETALVEFATGGRLDSLDELRAVGAELDSQRRQADQAETDANDLASELEFHLTELAAARELQSEAVDQANARLDDKLAELAALESIDAQLAAEIRNEEQRIADRIAAENRRNSGSYTIPDDLEVDLVSVRGITVNVAIADRLEGLLAAMAARGYSLSGGGYRSPEAQIRLRRAHCGTSEYAIWQMPASRCRPPTAPPGRSAHERGLAVDFTLNGRALRSRDSGVFRALKEVAPDFGFINLPSEPWHWSVTGT